MGESTRSIAARTAARNMAALAVSRVVVAVSGAVVLSVLYGRLGVHDFGVWIVLNGLVGVITLLDLGFGSAIVRDVAASSGEPTDRIRSTAGLALVWSLAVVAVGMLLVSGPWSIQAALLNLGPADGGVRAATIVLMAATAFDIVLLPWRASLEGLQRYVAIARINVTTAVLGSVVLVLVASRGGDLVALALVTLVASATRGMAIFLLAGRVCPALFPRVRSITPSHARSVVRYGSRVQVTTLTAVVNLELDRFVLAGRFGPAVAGGFEVGSRVAGLFRLVPALVLVALFPMVVTESTRRDTEWLAQFNLFVTKWLGAATIVMAGGFVAAADPAVRAWLGTEDRHAVMAILVLVPAYAVTMLAGAIGILVRLEGRPGLETKYAVISVVVNLALTWPLMVLWGPVGIPLATAAGIGVGVAYFVVAYHRRIQQSLRPFLAVTVPPVLAACVGATAGWTVQAIWATHELGRPGLAGVAVVSGLVAVVVASGALVVGGFWSAQDRDRLRGVWQAFGDRRGLGDAS